ncbi:MAG TPA: hypothetical protein VF809_02945 [Candidatus Saccharimonadales bacterium]
MSEFTSGFEEPLDRPGQTLYGEHIGADPLDDLELSFAYPQDMSDPEDRGDDETDPAAQYLNGLGDTPDNPMAESEEPVADASDHGNTPPPVGPRSEAAASGEDPLDGADHDDSLASFDVPDTEVACLRSDQEIAGIQYQTTLDEAGLGIGSSAFTPGLVVKDGEAFVRRLATVPDEGHDTLLKGMADVVSGALSSVMLAHVPNVVDREYPGYYLEAGFQPDAVANLKEYRQSTAQVLMYAQEIAEGLDNIGTDPTIARDLRNAQTAEIEGMLPEWAMAQHMGLYDAPTTNSLDRGWTQLVEPEEWQVLVDFVEQTSAKAPPHSVFVRTLAATAADNIHRLRTGVLEPSKRGAMLPIECDDDDDGMSFARSMELREDSESDAAAQEWERQYEAVLDAAEQRVRAVIAHHEADLDPIDEWLLADPDPEAERRSEIADAYVNGATMPPDVAAAFFGVSQREICDLLASLPPEEVAALNEQRELAEQDDAEHQRYAAAVRDRLSEAAPSLLQARLPQSQEALMGEGARYILGTNQSALYDAGDFRGYLEEFRGVSVTGNTLHQRFLFVDGSLDPHHLDEAMVNGYYGRNGGGRMVVAVPHDGSISGENVNSTPDLLGQRGMLPTDFIVDVNNGQSVNRRYVAGFIDVEGTYHPNPGFMR